MNHKKDGKWIETLGTKSIDFSYLNINKINQLYQQGNPESSSSNLYLILGDLHGNIKAAILLAIRLQTLFKINFKAVFQVGDFGFWPTGVAAKLEEPYYKKEDALDFFELNKGKASDMLFALGRTKLEQLIAPFYFIRGNHEDFKHLNLLSQKIPSEVATKIYFLPDYFQGITEGLNIATLGGIAIDLERGRGKKAKIQFKKAQQKIQNDLRCSSVLPLIQSILPDKEIDLLLTHSGLAFRENRDGSKQLETYLSQSNIPLHIHGHHHRFAIDRIGSNTLSIGLRNLELAQNGQLIPGNFALLNWQDRTNFALYSDVTVRC
jgi:predicted phosphodiesterase